MDTPNNDDNSCGGGCLIFVVAIICISLGIIFLVNEYDSYIYCSLLLIGIVALIGGIYCLKWSDMKSLQQEKERKQNAQDAYNQKLEEYNQKYGGITTCIRFNGEIPNEQEFIVFEDAKTLIIDNNAYNFEEILDAELIVDKGDKISTFKTKSSLGSTAGRAIVGGIIAGPAGAIIGGTTGSKKTVTESVETKPDHYTVIIYLRRMGSLIVKCDCQDNMDAAYSIMAVLKVILNNKTNS